MLLTCLHNLIGSIIAGKKGSVLSVLEDVTKRPPQDSNKIDSTLESALQKTLKFSKRGDGNIKAVPPSYSRAQGLGFVVEHYAESVVYDVGGWVEKNADKLTQDIYTCMQSSKDTDFLLQAFAVSCVACALPWLAGISGA